MIAAAFALSAITIGVIGAIVIGTACAVITIYLGKVINMNAPRRIVQTDEGWKVWEGNRLIAFTDENDLLYIMVAGYAEATETAHSIREIESILAEYNV